MANRIMDMGLEVSVDNETGMLDVRGENDKLQSVRQMLDNEGYIDDTEIACGMFGMTPATDFISRMFICPFGNGNNGYMAMA